MITVQNNTFIATGTPGNVLEGAAYHAEWTIAKVQPYEDEEIFATGFVKWDGCSNWTFNTTACMHHACNRKMLADVGDILAKCFDASSQVIPETWCF